MLTISSSSLTPALRRPILRRRYSVTSDLYRPRTILIEKPISSASYGFSIQTYGFASLNPVPTDESAGSLLSLSSESTRSRQSSASNSFCLSASQIAPIQLVTYVDHVQEQSPAWLAGLRAGSVIVSVNDDGVEHDDHETLVKRITQASVGHLKLIVIQQNINKQIALCEQLQKLHKQLQEKEDELEELCKQENQHEPENTVEETKSPSPRLERLSGETLECPPTFCHDKIPLDWRQSVTTFAHQQKLTTRTLPPILTNTASSASARYRKKRHFPASNTHRHQRSRSLSTIVLQYSKPALFRQHASLKHQRRSSDRRALSHEELFTCDKANELSSHPKDDSMVASGCSLAMDLSSTIEKTRHDVSSSSSSSTVNSEDEEDTSSERTDNPIQQFKWKLRISK